MCGRYQFSADEYKEIRRIVRDAQRRSEGNELNFPMAGDICPSQMAPVLVSRGEKIVGEFQQWGLPGFRGRQQIINARAETVTEKPMFRRSIAFRRCVIPATGFYEWDAAKHKYFFQMPGQPIYLAGIYDTISGVNCFIILTTAPNDSVAPIHDRMPLLLFYYEGYTTAEAASMLGIPEKTVSTRLYRARAKLRTILEEE